MRVLDGNAGHRPINKDEPIPDVDLRDPPAELDARRAAIWRHAIKHAPPGMLKELDASVFYSWVSWMAVLETAGSQVAALGLYVKDGDKRIRNPYLRDQREATTQLKALASELGFSPTSRSRVKVARKPAAGAGANPFGALKDLPS